uniref:Kinesin-like protein KIN-14D n=1 Tax=Oryza sativa subsp. japonica TaxID=39947 RepID=KN14D_ORYSJ|nr:RecName: Full=Kinesin-like protein KIN-14D [Oryza sativa Japonica Group]
MSSSNNAAAAAASPDPSRRREDVVGWLLALFPDLPLPPPPEATDEDLRAALATGRLLCALLRRLCPGALLDDASTDNVGRFRAAVERMGVAKFSASDLERGQMTAVVNCILALKDRFGSRGGDDHRNPGFLTRCDSEGGRKRVESKLQRMLTSPIMSGIPGVDKLTIATDFVMVFQLKQGGYADQLGGKYSDLLKSTSLDNAPTQSLLGVFNSILDESIERKNGQIPYRIACLLRKVILEIERRISTQAGHIRNQNNLIKAREEKYQSRIRVLEVLAGGVSGQTHEKEGMINLKTVKAEETQRIEDEESKKEDVARLLTDKENNDSIISELKKELEETKRLHEAHSQQLETKAAQVSKELEQRIEEVKLMLDDSTKRRIELEELSETRIQFWKKKEVVIDQFVSLQVQNVQDLKLSSVSVRHEILNCQNKWSEELAGLGKSLKVVTNTAEKYHGALAENRKLFNEIQELKGNIRVYCRIRPFRPGEDDKSSSVEYIGDNGELVLSNPTKQGKEGGKNFTFNKVFGPITTQDAVFKDIQPLIRSVLDGYNVCIFAYGQTGSGKTYTMMGPEKATEKEWGVNYRALNDLFNISHDRRDTITYELGVQMIEIYNEQIRDLLGSGGVQKKLGIQNTIQPNGLAVPDATMCPVTSTSHVIELMQTGHDNRAMSATALNERSSRSHSVVTIHVRGQDLKTGNTLRGALHLVDLAGSERVDRSAVTGDRLKEAQHINKSLAALGDVIFSLSQKNAHVPYRNSKLTQVLQTSLGGHAKTLMFVQVNPDVSSYTETLSTLKFAERVSGVELGVARSNKEGKEGKDVKELMDQLSLLKDTISKKDEEIDRLQLLNSSTRLKPTRQADSVLKHSSSSPGITSLGKGTSVGSGAASDLDNFSDTSDRQSEAGSMLSVDPEISGLADVDSDGRTRAVNRVQKLTLPKAGQSSSLRPKPRDPAPAATGVRKSSTSQATPLARNNSTLKRGP